MTITEILEQARALSPQERKELVKQLVDTLDLAPNQIANPSEEHWGKSLNRLLDVSGPIELKYPEIEDPVAWVQHLRAEQHRNRLESLMDESEHNV